MASTFVKQNMTIGMKVLDNKRNHFRVAAYIFVGVLLVKILIMASGINVPYALAQVFVNKTQPALPTIQSVSAGMEQQLSLLPHVDVLLITCVLTTLIGFLRVPATPKNTSSEPSNRIIANKLTKQVGSFRKAEVKNITEDYFNAIDVLKGITKGDFTIDVLIDAQHPRPLPQLLQKVQHQFKEMIDKDKHEGWVQTNMYGLEKLLKDDHNQSVLNAEIIKLLSKSVAAGVGILYNWNTEGYFEQLGSYGFFDNLRLERKIPGGQGQLGEVSNHKAPVFLNNLPKGYLVIQSGLGSATATDVAIFPLLFKDELYGAIELALFRPLTKNEILWMERAAESVGAHLFNHKVNQDAKLKLEQLAKKQAEELVEVHRLQQSTYEKLEVKLKEVEDERLKNEAILNGCVDGVITFNEQGIVEFCNGVAEEILVCKREEINGNSIRQFIPIEIRLEHGIWKAYYTTSSGAKEIGVRTEATLTTSAGESVDVLMTCTKVTHKGGMIFTFFIQKISVDLF